MGTHYADASPAQANAQGRDRRAAERYDLEDLQGSLIYKGTGMPCTLVDISLTGCCVRSAQPFRAGALETVRVVIPIDELVLAVWGITRWVHGERLLGIQFRALDEASKNQLMSLLTCLVDKSASEVVKAAIAQIAANKVDNPMLQVKPASSAAFNAGSISPPSEPAGDGAGSALPVAAQQDSGGGTRAPAEGGPPDAARGGPALSMEVGDSPALLALRNEDRVVPGDIVELSPSGCSIRLARLPAVGMEAEVELSFHLSGRHLRLSGITRRMRDESTVEVDFAFDGGLSRDDLMQALALAAARAGRQP